MMLRANYVATRFVRTSMMRSKVRVGPVLCRSFADLPPYEELPMPALSPTMESGTISKWVKNEGDEIAAGDLIAEVETDKATVDYEAQDDGFLAKIIIDEGVADVPCGKTVAIVVENAEDIAAFANFVPDESGAEDDAPAAAAAAEPEASVTSPSESSQAQAVQQSKSDGSRVFASPLAKKLVRESDSALDLSTVSGSGPGGRVLKDDVIAALNAAPAASSIVSTPNVDATPTASPSAATIPLSTSNFADEPIGRIRKIIAQNTVSSKQNLPHYYLTVELRLDELLSLRAKLNANKSDSKISVNDFVIKASALACKAVPEVNSSWVTREDGTNAIRTYEHVDVNVGMSTDMGLISPVVRNAHNVGLAAISNRVRGLASAAREDKLEPGDHDAGTFTVSNLGMFGIKQFTAIISQPQVCILAVGAAEDRVVPNDNLSEDDPEALPYKVEKRMNVTLSCDHRVVDGAVGAQWLQSFKGYIEDPVTMLL